MKRIMRLTETELMNIINESAKRIVKEHLDMNREIEFAYKEVQQMGKNLSSLGLRLNGTEYEPLYQRLKDAMIGLNNELIKQLRQNR
jgi:flagellar biosynthesis/type III secretory pathway protein FliH